MFAERLTYSSGLFHHQPRSRREHLHSTLQVFSFGQSPVRRALGSGRGSLHG
ncbi:6725_t:CDS:1, partial [Acaulospora colombiana]